MCAGASPLEAERGADDEDVVSGRVRESDKARLTGSGFCTGRINSCAVDVIGRDAGALEADRERSGQRADVLALRTDPAATGASPGTMAGAVAGRALATTTFRTMRFGEGAATGSAVSSNIVSSMGDSWDADMATRATLTGTGRDRFAGDFWAAITCCFGAALVADGAKRPGPFGAEARAATFFGSVPLDGATEALGAVCIFAFWAAMRGSARPPVAACFMGLDRACFGALAGITVSGFGFATTRLAPPGNVPAAVTFAPMRIAGLLTAGP
jgi:hypothetical protein